MSPRSTPPVLGPPPTATLPPVQHLRLGNGLEVLIVERPELPVLDARFVVRHGAAADAPAQAGRSYMLAEVLDQGTGQLSATDIADRVELIGATLETRATWDSITIALHVLSPRMEPALQLLAYVVADATLPEAEVDRKRSERLAAILQEQDEPRILATKAFYRVVYPADHPFSMPLAGNRPTIECVSRSELVAARDRRFVPSEAFLVLVGDVSAASIAPLLERLFGGWSGSTPEGAAGPGGVPQSQARVHIVDRPGAPQSELRVGLPGPRRDTEDYFPLLVANTVLGGAFTSRLNMRLREEKAYTYGAGSSFAFRREGGPFLASTAVATAATADAVDVIRTEIARMSDELVPAAELERARSYIVLGLPRTFETTGDIAEHVSDVALYGLGDDYYDRYVEQVLAVSAGRVRDAAARWLRADALSIAIAGDADAIRNELEAMKIGAVDAGEVG